MLLEILLEVFYEGLSDASGNAKIPKIVRYILFSILCFIPISVSFLCCFSSYKATGLVGAIICAFITLFLIFLWLYGLIKISKYKKDK